jgi:hypothetical protein
MMTEGEYNGDAVLVINLRDHLRILENNNLDLVFNRYIWLVCALDDPASIHLVKSVIGVWVFCFFLVCCCSLLYGMSMSLEGGEMSETKGI